MIGVVLVLVLVCMGVTVCMCARVLPCNWCVRVCGTGSYSI